jgi:ABC-type glycerol-3-phosphate transport system substrate-binding protein
MPYEAVATTVIAASAAGTGPDICYYAANLIPNRIGQGMTLPLNRYLDAYAEKRDFVPDLFASVSDSKGQVDAMPFAMWGTFDLYNTEALATSGVEMPNDWDSLLKATRKMTRYDSDGTVRAYGYANTHSRTSAFYGLHLAMELLDRGIISIGDTEEDLNNERGVRALNYLHDLWQTGMPDNNPNAHLLDSHDWKSSHSRIRHLQPPGCRPRERATWSPNA